MRKLSALLFIALFLTSPFFINKTNAAEFDQAYVRLDRLKANSPLSGQVCAKPSAANAGTEAKVSILFPSDFSLSSNTSNWSSSTSNLPSGATAWPGISLNATSISGRTVTFGSNDLTSGSALYCFNFTASSSTTGSTGEREGTVTTLNSSNGTIDLSNYALEIVSNDQIVVTATVPADASDYSVDLEKLTSGDEFSENQEIEYRVIYGTTLSYATDITLEASWSLGTIEGQSSPTVEVLGYVSGSASDAYNSTPPVIDSSNRKITWQISNFPGNTVNQTVRFKLKTTQNYTGTSRVSFTNEALIIFPGGQTDASEVSNYYRKSGSSSSSSSSSSSTSTSPTPAPTAATKPLITKVDIRQITSKYANIFVQSNKATRKTINYGESLRNLNLSISASSAESNIFRLNNLKPNTKYYFRLTAIDSNNERITSDFYTFTTAELSEPLSADLESFVATSRDTIISLIGGLAQEVQVKNNFLVIPVDTVFQFKFSTANRISARNVKAIVRPKVLGSNTFFKQAEASSESSDLIEVEPGVYAGNIQTKNEPGTYELYVRITDLKGNLTEQKIADIKVIDKMKVFSGKNGKRLEGARVLLYIFNPSTKTYQVIPSANLIGGNPQFTNKDGLVDVVLPQTKYKAEISHLHHQDQTVEFVIGVNEGQEYPKVELQSAPLSLAKIARYYFRSINDVFLLNTSIYAGVLSESSRFFDLIAALTLTALVGLTFYAFSRRHHIPLRSMPTYIYYLLDRNDKSEKYIHGVIYDENEKPISGANVYLTDRQNERIVSSTKANNRGEFFFKKGSGEYSIMAMAKSYKSSPQIDYHDKEHVKFKITLELHHEGINIIENLRHVASRMLGMSFEALLLASLFFEVLFIRSFGLERTLPFFAISIFNLLFWTLHLRHHN